MINFDVRDELVIDPHKRDEARDNLDNALIRLEASFGRMRSALSRERNSSVLAVRLPSEILVEIFGYGGVQAALLATRVCHRWRLAAFSQASLWSRVNMESRNHSAHLLQVQLERAGSYPLDLTFRLRTDGLGQVVNLMVPDNPMSIIKKASSIANLSTRTASQEQSYTLPLLQSLHLCVDPAHAAWPRALKPCNLRHCSIDFFSHPFVLFSQSMRNLSTLHWKRSIEPVINVLKTVANISRLQELLLETCKNNEDPPPELLDDIIQNQRFDSLKRLYLKDVSLSFLTCFLHPGIVASMTNIRIEHCPPPSLQLQRGCPASSIWIDFNLNHVLYQHGFHEVFTQISLGEANESIFTYTMPKFVSCEGITALFWTGANLRDPPFNSCPSLVKVAFEFHPARVGDPKESLTGLIGSYLASSCSQLQYLGISIRRPKMSSAILQRDDAEDAVSSFLEAWVNFYGEVFSTLELYDENRPGRWGQRLDVLKACAGIFEIKRRCVLEGLKAPTFPSLRRFITEPEEDERDQLSFRGFAQTFW